MCGNGSPNNPDISYVEENMRKALSLARQAFSLGEIPVGCVILKNGNVIASSVNTVERDRNRLKHCEMNAISAVFDYFSENGLPDKDLSDCDMFVTLEPCRMCAGAVLNARVGRLFFGAYDSERGGCLSDCNIPHSTTLVFGGIMREECESLLKDFFSNLRK